MEVDASTVIGAILTFLAAVGGVVVVAAQAGAKRGAELAVEQAHWPETLRQELEKVRGTERQELRYTAYSGLWAKQRPLAVYDASPPARYDTFGPAQAASLMNAQSDWYFNEAGGLLLTTHVRDFYFAWQDFLQAVARVPAWTAKRSTDDPSVLFRRILCAGGRGMESERLWGALRTLSYLKRVNGPRGPWPAKADAFAARWRRDVGRLAEGWNELNAGQQFAVLQQVSSTLRTVMTNDIESRVR